MNYSSNMSLQNTCPPCSQMRDSGLKGCEGLGKEAVLTFIGQTSSQGGGHTSYIQNKKKRQSTQAKFKGLYDSVCVCVCTVITATNRLQIATTRALGRVQFESDSIFTHPSPKKHHPRGLVREGTMLVSF